MESAGARSVMSNDMKELHLGKEQISNQIRGHKANLSNPNTSEESKEHSRQQIEALGGDANMISNMDDNRSKNVADKLNGSRAM